MIHLHGNLKKDVYHLRNKNIQTYYTHNSNSVKDMKKPKKMVNKVF